MVFRSESSEWNGVACGVEEIREGRCAEDVSGCEGRRSQERRGSGGR